MKRQTQDIGQCSCEMGRSHLNFLSTPGNTYTLEFSLPQACFATAVNNFFEVDDVFVAYEEEQVVEKMNYSVNNQYRYSFQNQEKLDEIRGKGNYINYKYRGYDPRVGRLDWLIDPLASQYPWNSPYAFSENRVLDGVELEGLEWKATEDKEGKEWNNLVAKRDRLATRIGINQGLSDINNTLKKDNSFRANKISKLQGKLDKTESRLGELRKTNASRYTPSIEVGELEGGEIVRD